MHAIKKNIIHSTTKRRFILQVNLIGVFFFSKGENGMGVFGTAGTIFFPLLQNDVMINKGAEHLQGSTDAYIPIVSYDGGSLQQGEAIVFKSLFSVEQEDGRIVNGGIEDGFALYLTDIKSSAGKSVLEKMSTDDLSNMEEIPSAFVYDKELDMLYVFGSGDFTVMLKIYSDKGGMETYEFQLPIELL